MSMPLAGVPDDPQWNGIYSAQIAVTQDPLNQGRVRLFIPQILGTAQSNWATAMQPGITPAAGTQVLAVFLGGNINLPYYFVGVSSSLIEAVSSGSTVLNSNPFFTGNLLTGWAATNGALLAVQPNADTNPPFPNSAFLSLSGTGGGYIQESLAPFTAVVGNYYQVQAWVYYPLGGGVNIGAFFPTAGALVTEMSVEPGTWTNISVTVQATDTAGYPMVGPVESNPNDQFYATAICVIGQPNAAEIGGIINGYNAFGTVIGGSAFLLYNGIPQAGNLIGSWAPAAGGVDLFGNDYPIGFNAVQGDITGMGVSNAQIMQSTLSNCSSIAETLSNPNINGGLMVETTITFDTTGGVLLAYATTTTTISQNSNGTFNWTCPAGVTAAGVQCWGAGAGGSGNGVDAGQNTGGPSGGGGEFAAEFNYAVTPGQVYQYQVGNGGGGGANNAGSDGGDTSFDLANGGVFANGGIALSAPWTGGPGGTGSTNSIHFDGGSGASSTAGKTGGCSGANSGGLTGTGNAGISATSSSGAPAPASQSPNGRGGAGGAAGANGSNGGSPGAGGGGAGYQAGSSSFSHTWDASGSRSYYGADATNGSPNDFRAQNGTVWSGGETATGGSANGNQKSIITFPTNPTIENALVGVTVSQCTFTITNNHSWYNSGMSLGMKEWQTGGGAPASWDGLHPAAPLITTSTIAEGQRKSYNFGASVGRDFQNGVAFGIVLFNDGGAYNLNWYGYFNGTPNSSAGPQLTITGTTGAAPTSGGDGNDGQVFITFTSGSTIVCAISPTGGTDQFGNAFAVGYTGPTSTFTPGSAPATVETWHLVTPGSGYTNQSPDIRLQYRLTSDNMVQIVGTINASVWSGTLFTLPAAYCPSATTFMPCAIFPTADGSGFLTIGTSGAVTTSVGAGASALIINGSFPLGIT